MTDGRLYIFTGPAVAVIVAATFFLVWLYRRQYRYTLCFSVGFCAYAIAALMQILNIPYQGGLNALLTALIYAACIFLLSKGVLLRSGLRGGDSVYYLISAVVVLLVWYFFYIDRHTIARIYAQNFGYGLMVLIAAARIGALHSRRVIDRVLFWAVLLFGLHFFIRTALTVPISEDLFQLEKLRSDGADVSIIYHVFRRSPFWQVLNFTVLIFGFMLALAFLAAVVVDIIDDLHHESTLDVLTGLSNRRGFGMRVRNLMQTGRQGPFSLVYCDLDHFKSINDTYGHAAGDRVLQCFASIIESELRRCDVSARFGGEEFVMLLAESKLENAGVFAERLRARLVSLQVEGLENHQVTASFGVVEVGHRETLDEAIHRADMMAYQAKNSGRDRVCLDINIRTMPAASVA